MKTQRLLGLLLLAALLSVGITGRLMGQEGSPPTSPPSQESPPDDPSRLRDPSPAREKEAFLKDFTARGEDWSSLPIIDLPIGNGLRASPSLLNSVDESILIVRGEAHQVRFDGRMGMNNGFPSFFCYSIITFGVDEVIKGQMADSIQVVQGGCPQPGPKGTTLVQFASDPILRQGQDYLLFLTPGNDEGYAAAGFPEGHSSAGLHYHLGKPATGDPSAQFKMAGETVHAGQQSAPWAKALSVISLTEMKSFIANPFQAPVSSSAAEARPSKQ